ncbi:MAG: hypothetical protein AAGD01_07535 [Acidobacteriota bacterium]
MLNPRPPKELEHEDLRRLYVEAVNLAFTLLDGFGGFAPFAVVQRIDGTVLPFDTLDVGEPAPDARLIEHLTSLLQEEVVAQRVQASAVIFDAEVRPRGLLEPIDAICVRLEHHAQDPVTCYQTYRRQRKKLINGRVIVVPGLARIFPTKRPPR